MRTRPSINIGPVERVARVLVGALGAIGGAVLLWQGGSMLAIVLAALLVAAGLDLIITGALGHCPLYAKLGHIPAAVQRRTS